jgi:hypothetical protein
MPKLSYCLLLLLLLAAPMAWAQVPPLLVGQWEAHEIGFIAQEGVPDSVRERLDDPQIGALNVDIMRGDAQLLVEFRADGSYQFSVTRNGQLVRAETGTYSVAHDTLYARSPASPGGSSFNDQHLSRLTRRVLLLAFWVGSDLPGVTEEIEYRRHNH